MMKAKITVIALLCACTFTSASALADNHTVSIGYAQSKVEGFKDIRGVNVQYRYEWDSPFSIIGSFSYMQGDESYSYRTQYFGETTGYDVKTKLKYYSLLAGPSYRINDYVSLYALAGLANTRVEDRVVYSSQYAEDFNDNKTSFAYGAGVIINPTNSLSVSVGYEGTRVKYYENVAINGFNIGVGYRF